MDIDLNIPGGRDQLQKLTAQLLEGLRGCDLETAVVALISAMSMLIVSASDDREVRRALAEGIARTVVETVAVGSGVAAPAGAFPAANEAVQ